MSTTDIVDIQKLLGQWMHYILYMLILNMGEIQKLLDRWMHEIIYMLIMEIMDIH